MDSVTIPHSTCRILALLKNIGQGWKWLALTNSLAYYDRAKITGVKSFLVLGPYAVL